ncbi:MAG: NADAR family protein [Spirochaetales bacterium]|nr:NADAR family protein [Candidatus Physcosoma equi]
MSTRIYKRSESIVFCKTKEAFGGLSNMAAGFPIHINDVTAKSSEALYQALKFPGYPEIQKEIFDASNAYEAKQVSRKYQQNVRPDWCSIRFQVMEWCLKVKLATNWESFSKILKDTGEKPIVELSMKDPIWGAIPSGAELIGTNALGRLLMSVREQYILCRCPKMVILPPSIVDFKLFGEPVGPIHLDKNACTSIRLSAVMQAMNELQPQVNRELIELDLSKGTGLVRYPDYGIVKKISLNDDHAIIKSPNGNPEYIFNFKSLSIDSCQRIQTGMKPEVHRF